MSEEQIREIEIQSARVMGYWVVLHENSGVRYLEKADGSTVGYGRGDEGEIWQGHCPQFARDPGAKWEALEWLCSDTGESSRDVRRIIDNIKPFYSPERSFVHVAMGHDAIYPEGETLGIAICRAIVALGEKAERKG